MNHTNPDRLPVFETEKLALQISQKKDAVVRIFFRIKETLVNSYFFPRALLIGARSRKRIVLSILPLALKWES